MWGKFWKEDVQKQITHKVSDEVYAVYTDYETDFTVHGKKYQDGYKPEVKTFISVKD